MAGKKRIGFKNRYRHQTGSGVPKRWPVTSGCYRLARHKAQLVFGAPLIAKVSAPDFGAMHHSDRMETAAARAFRNWLVRQAAS
ncbi:hypothetical protein MKD50_19600 [Cupriavidus sp. WGtm5]|uniref:hypothetical protein n=1 Tax=Cupriavidus TaxID=106589 RepID=UPI001F00DABE|nr:MULTISPECIES: hypothetical protein [Cupriavidus]MCO4891591.1 hypothetical protein [Cupriavidus sp. WGtm5]ULX51671.1 hypothetical protein A9P79_06990 [Cupriavidus taiwanensis]